MHKKKVYVKLNSKMVKVRAETIFRSNSHSKKEDSGLCHLNDAEGV